MPWLLDLRERWLLGELRHARNVNSIRNREIQDLYDMKASSMAILRARKRLEKAIEREARLERALKS